MIFLQADALQFGPLSDLVSDAGVLFAAAAALLLTWKGRAAWEPSEQDIPHGAQRIAGLATVVAIAFLWLWRNDPSDLPFITKLALVLTATCVTAFLMYGILISIYTYQKPATPEGTGTNLIGGIWLTNSAKNDRLTYELTVQDLFARAGYDVDKIWSRPSRAFTKTTFTLCYVLLISSGTMATACASMMLHGSELQPATDQSGYHEVELDLRNMHFGSPLPVGEPFFVVGQVPLGTRRMEIRYIAHGEAFVVESSTTKNELHCRQLRSQTPFDCSWKPVEGLKWKNIDDGSSPTVFRILLPPLEADSLYLFDVRYVTDPRWNPADVCEELGVVLDRTLARVNSVDQFAAELEGFRASLLERVHSWMPHAHPDIESDSLLFVSTPWNQLRWPHKIEFLERVNELLLAQQRHNNAMSQRALDAVELADYLTLLGDDETLRIQIAAKNGSLGDGQLFAGTFNRAMVERLASGGSPLTRSPAPSFGRSSDASVAYSAAEGYSATVDQLIKLRELVSEDLQLLGWIAQAESIAARLSATSRHSAKALEARNTALDDLTSIVCDATATIGMIHVGRVSSGATGLVGVFGIDGSAVTRSAEHFHGSAADAARLGARTASWMFPTAPAPGSPRR